MGIIHCVIILDGNNHCVIILDGNNRCVIILDGNNHCVIILVGNNEISGTTCLLNLAPFLRCVVLVSQIPRTNPARTAAPPAPDYVFVILPSGGEGRA